MASFDDDVVGISDDPQVACRGPDAPVPFQVVAQSQNIPPKTGELSMDVTSHHVTRSRIRIDLLGCEAMPPTRSYLIGPEHRPRTHNGFRYSLQAMSNDTGQTRGRGDHGDSRIKNTYDRQPEFKVNATQRLVVELGQNPSFISQESVSAIPFSGQCLSCPYINAPRPLRHALCPHLHLPSWRDGHKLMASPP